MSRIYQARGTYGSLIKVCAYSKYKQAVREAATICLRPLQVDL